MKPIEYVELLAEMGGVKIKTHDGGYLIFWEDKIFWGVKLENALVDAYESATKKYGEEMGWVK